MPGKSKNAPLTPKLTTSRKRMTPVKAKADKPPVPTEHQEQKALFQLARMFASRIPQLELLYAVPNGAKLPFSYNIKGQRISKQARVLKEEGMRAGVPDMFLPIARNGKHGLYLELKRSDHSYHPSEEQRWWFARLRAEGYACEVCYGCEAAWAVILDYLGEKITV